MTMFDVYKLSKALIAIADGVPASNFKGSISKAREFKENYEKVNDKYIRSNKYAD